MFGRRDALIFVLAMFSLAAKAQSPILGVLEDVPPFGSGMPHRRAVRVVFEKEGSEWQAFPSNCSDEHCLSSISVKYPLEIVWTVAFDGRSLGQITSTTPQRFGYYAEVGLQRITSASSVPTVGERSREFGGQTDALVYRPLVTNSNPFVSDPEVWKRSTLSLGQVSRVRQAFRQHFGKLCQLAEDHTHLKPLEYTNENLAIVSTYKAKTGWAIARVRLQGAIDCADTEAGFEIDDSWFALDPQMQVQHLGDGIWLVDAGDYDNDGHSELIFSINRDDSGGYELFYDQLKKHAVFQYIYH
jgi:hypothetical protein